LKNNEKPLRIDALGFAALFVIIVAAACGQDEIEWPETDGGTGGGKCQSWYPQPNSSNGSEEYGVKEGSIIGCLVWKNVIKNGSPSYLSMGELYLKSTEDASGPASMLVVMASRNCPGCGSLIEAISTRKKDFEQADTVMVAVAASDVQDSTVHLTLDEAYDLLVEDGWNSEWYFMNDEEGFLESFYAPSPQTIIIDLESMKVLSISSSRFTQDNIDELLDFIKANKAN